MNVIYRLHIHQILCAAGGINQLCRCGPLGGVDGREQSHRDEWLRSGNVSGFIVQHNDYFIGWLVCQ